LTGTPFYALLADLILLVHGLFVSFVVFGQILVVGGALLRWEWVRNWCFRLVHLLGIGYVIIETWAGKPCPLTVWESELRDSASQAGYAGSFVTHWLHRLFFFEAEGWVFTLVYSVFGLFVVATWIFVPPRRAPKPQRRAGANCA